MIIELNNDGETVTMEIREFFDMNEMDAGERREIVDHLELNGVYFGGGGAAGEWVATVIQ